MSAQGFSATAHRVHGKQTRRIVQAAISVVIVVGVFAFAVPKFASYSSAGAVLRQLGWAQVALLLALAALTWSPTGPGRWPPCPASASGRRRSATRPPSRSPTPCPPVACWRSASPTRCCALGFPPSAIALLKPLDGIWDVFAKLAMPVLAVVLLAVTGSHKLSLLVPALIGLAVLVGAVALFALLTWKKAVALAGRGARHGHLAAAAAAAQAAGAWLGQGGGPLPAPLQRPGRLPLAGADRRHHHQPPGAVPGLPRGRPSGRHQPRAGELGGGPRRLLARPAAVGLTPGGVGVAELTYIAGLVLAGGGVRAAAVAATLLFRLLTDGLEIPLGGITYLIWLRNKRWRAVPPATAPAAVLASPP